MNQDVILAAVDTAHVRVVEWLLATPSVRTGSPSPSLPGFNLDGFVERTHLILSGLSTVLSGAEPCVRGIVRGNVELVALLTASGASLPDDDGLYAATASEMGHLAVLQFLRTTAGCMWDHRVLWFALLNNHLGLALWAVENGCPVFGTAHQPLQPGAVEGLRSWLQAQLTQAVGGSSPLQAS